METIFRFRRQQQIKFPSIRNKPKLDHSSSLQRLDIFQIKKETRKSIKWRQTKIININPYVTNVDIE